jgi:hypothetical protein
VEICLPEDEGFFRSHFREIYRNDSFLLLEVL